MDYAEMSEEQKDEAVEKAVFETALGGNTSAQFFWLKNRMPHKWRDKPELGGGDNGVLTELLEHWNKKRRKGVNKL